MRISYQQTTSDLVLGVLFVVGLWGVFIATSNDFILLLAVTWSFRVLIVDLRSYRLLTRGRTWFPSTDPDDYR